MSKSETRAKESSWTIPWDVAGRIALLFAALCSLQLIQLAGFRKHLYEVHWRIVSETYDWLDDAAFYLFVALVALNLWQFARRCAAKGTPSVRAANALVLAAGGVFILFTLKFDGHNFLYPLFDHTLSWWDLRWYASQSFFFQSPFLAAWIFVYAAVYYILARTKREHLVLHATIIFAVAYLLAYERDLTICRTALLTADCLGIACAAAGTGILQRGNWLCTVAPWLWFGFLFLIFQSHENQPVLDDPEATTLWGWSIALFVGLSALAWRKKIAAEWLWLLPFASVSFLLLTNVNFDNALNYRYLLFLGLTLPRYFLGAFFIAAILLVVATIYRRWLPKASLLWLDVINLILILIALADLRLSQIMGIRLDWQAIHFGADPKMIWRLSKSYLPGLIAALVVIVALYAIVIGLWRREKINESARIGGGLRFLVVTFLLLGLLGRFFAANDKVEGQSAILLAASTPMFAKLDSSVMDENAVRQTAAQLGESSMLQLPSPPHNARRDLNVVVIFQESTYNKFLSLFSGAENTEPLLSQYTNRMELFPNFFSAFEGSIYARFASFTGVYPVKDYDAFTFHRVPVKSLFEILRDNGYDNSLFYSSYFDYTGFRDFLQGRSIGMMYDTDTMPERNPGATISWGLPEEETLRAMQLQIRQYATNHQKFFLTYVPAAPHNPFDGIPEQFKKYSIKTPGDFTPAYLNSLLYMDWIIASILDELKNSGLLDNTLVIITGDHGEMLGENGGPVGHGWAVTPQLANVPLIIMDPAKQNYSVNDTVGSQVDLLPTILDLLGIATPDDQLYQGTSLYSDRAHADRTIYLNAFQQFGIVEGSNFICGNRETENAGTNGLKTYAIVNNGAKTIFVETNSASSAIPSIEKFDKFQENLLQNYSQYSQIKK